MQLLQFVYHLTDSALLKAQILPQRPLRHIDLAFEELVMEEQEQFQGESVVQLSEKAMTFL